MTNTTPHRATAEQWESLRDDDAIFAYEACILELRARVEALEAATATPPEPAPAGSLVEAVVEAMKCAEASWSGEARAAIRAVAERLDTKGQHGCSLWLREEVEQ